MTIPKPCPFCGGTAVEIVEGSTFRWKKAECITCGASAGEVRVRTIAPFDPEDDNRRVTEEWNRRAT